MPDHDVDYVDQVREGVEEEPVGVVGGVVVREDEANRDEPDVVVEGHRHNSQPGDVATVCEGVGGVEVVHLFKRKRDGLSNVQTLQAKKQKKMSI